MTTTTNSGKVQCLICKENGKKYEAHILVKHLKDVHPKTDVFDYITEYDAQIASVHGFGVLKRMHDLNPIRSQTPGKVFELFELEAEKDEAKNSHRKFVNRNVQAFDEPGPFTPPVDTDYVFPEQQLRALLLGLALKERNRVWLHGYAGTGKTQLVTQVCARLNYGLMRINGDTAITRRHLIGDWTVKNGETVFQYGVVPTAMREGHVLLIDEIDHLNPPTLALLRAVLEDPSQLIVLENGNEVIKAHPNFRVVATANTAGAGDESGLFVTARAMSLADRQRFSIWVRVDYLPAKVECGMIKKRFPKLTDIELKRFYQVVRTIRQRHKAGELEESFSPREFINWVEKYFMLGDAMDSAQICFLDRYQSPSVNIAVTDLVKLAFDEQKVPKDIEEDK